MTTLLIRPGCGCSIRKGQIEYCTKHFAADTLLQACKAAQVYLELDRRLTVKKILERAVTLAEPC